MGSLHLTLASASPRRRALLERLSLVPDAIIPADIDETPLPGELPRAYALRMGREKARAVSGAVSGAPAAPGFVLAGDTVVAVGRRILPKTETQAAARACLTLMSGRRHQVLTSVVLCAPDGTMRERLSETVVHFKRLSHAEIAAYLASDEWRGKWQMEGGGVLVNQAPPHQLDIFQWLMGPLDEVYGVWSNLNHPYIEVEDTALAIVKFKSGGIGNIIVSNSQKPGIYGKVHVHGSNGASVGVQTDGGSMFIAGMTGILEPPVNDIWSVPGEEKMLEQWKAEDSAHFNSIDPMVFYMERQIEDFLRAIENNSSPLVTGEDGRRTVELFTAIYRSTRDNKPVKFPLQPENKTDMDGRLK